MKLVDLDPRWLVTDGKRVGLVFRNPVRPEWWVSCFFEPTTLDEQVSVIERAIGHGTRFQTCNPSCRWDVEGGAEAASLSTITITPSLDGGPSMWHGNITRGEIVGGI